MFGRKYVVSVIAIVLFCLGGVARGDEFPMGVYTWGGFPNWLQMDSCGLNFAIEWADDSTLDNAANVDIKIIGDNAEWPIGKYRKGYYSFWESEEDVASGIGIKHDAGEEIDGPLCLGWKGMEGNGGNNINRRFFAKGSSLWTGSKER
ncbi:hypothetical protein CH333_02130 [candidate division WOR-3 bacterium JGI_Cruoil_03_44_89]|uniref:Uncharacterized protein n=1 Tax=candidate division WOR-3 bacterium JGI_Cruoil_03_44_89 TaxID=1973748 RepID=A0A235BXS4_UNCW3|nr:MAG: hypothetical protein CH333_02130 [candidate division WOR-3 bacterium JGI_Cruoil_03_44_89]